MLLAVKQYQACLLQVSRNCKKRLCIYILNLKPTISTFADEVSNDSRLFTRFSRVVRAAFQGFKTDLPGLVQKDTLRSIGNSQELKSGIQTFNLSRF